MKFGVPAALRSLLPPLTLALLGLGGLAWVQWGGGLLASSGGPESHHRPYEGWPVTSPEFGAMVDRLRVDSALPMPVPLKTATPAPALVVVPPHPTYNHDVGPILDQNCVVCHRPGGNAQASLADYTAALHHARDIARETAKRAMPPWGPAPGWGSFQGERRLTEAQIQTVQDWVRDGCPEGAVAPSMPRGRNWLLGVPDAELTLPPFTVPAEGPGWYHCFILPLPFQQAVGVEATDFDPGDHAVVHHAQFYLDGHHEARNLCPGPLEQGYDALGYFGPGIPPTGGLGSWQPGQLPIRLPSGAAFKVDRDTDLVVQIHLMPSGMAETIHPRIAIYLSHSHVQQQVSTFMLTTGPLSIPPGQAHYVVRDHFVLPCGMTVYSIKPHGHLLCQDIQAVATLPSGEVEPMVWIPHWNMDWQQAYYYQVPLHLPAGTRLDMQWIYDNTEANPRNPTRPPHVTHWGEAFSDEMAIMSIGFSPDEHRDLEPFLQTVHDRNYIHRALRQPGVGDVQDDDDGPDPDGAP